ncbi:MAG: hypothetical protein V4703_09195, partial [Actinomycetota bacterium]
MESPERSQIPLEVRLKLSRAAIETIARRAGIRLLHIKGDTVDPSIRPVSRPSSDVDAIIEPDGMRILHWHLLQNGWKVHSTYLDGSPFGHAQTYHHPDWGYFDLHRRFPGIRIADRQAFELLWTDRSVHENVGVTCAIPSLDCQAVLYMLNAARGNPMRRDEARAMWRAQNPEDRRRRRMLVSRLRADVAFDVTMGELERHRRSREYPLWRSILHGSDRSTEWWARVIGARTPLEGVVTLLRAPLANRSHLAHELGRKPRATEVMAATVKRWGTGIRELFR